MNVIEQIYIYIQKILSFLTGSTECVCCGDKTYAIPLCKKCKLKVLQFEPFDSNRRCQCCRKILISEISICSECRNNLVKQEVDSNQKVQINQIRKSRSLDQVFPINTYLLWQKDLMFAWKVLGQRGLSIFFADLVFNAICSIKKMGFDFDYIVPVPIRPGKLKKVGWDQVDDLIRILKSKYKLSIADVLERISFTEQKKLTKEERKGTLGAIYKIKNEFDKNIQLNSKKILILDDVITTGATMEKCSVILKQNGAKQVYGLSLYNVS